MTEDQIHVVPYSTRSRISSQTDILTLQFIGLSPGTPGNAHGRSFSKQKKIKCVKVL